MTINPENITKEEFERHLKAEYPRIFKLMGEQDTPPPYHCITLFGIEVNRGWWKIVEEFATASEDIANIYPEEDFSVCQIKEKWGELRIYTTYSMDIIEKLIDEAEKKATTICENCGSIGENRCKYGWYTTLCDKCSGVQNNEIYGDENNGK
jgi:hypothetical protein